jgi:ABC-type sulfate transport system substrate-binding protein
MKMPTLTRRALLVAAASATFAWAAPAAAQVTLLNVSYDVAR